MAVVRDYMNGPCRIIIHDDCICAPEEVQGIVDRVSRIVLSEELRRNMMKKRQAAEGSPEIQDVHKSEVGNKND